MTADPVTAMPLEERLSRLEAIVSELEGDDVELEAALALFEEGIGHVRAARRVLEEAELRIERLVDDGDDVHSEPMERDDG